MNAILTALKLNGPNKGSAKLLAGPVLILMILSMMILPLPPLVLDMFFTFNISLSIMILLVAMFTKKPLDFAAFPSVLLFATLLRLSLNVASTRIILMDGHKGPEAAGQVIESFGHFLVGGNFAVGVVIFSILVLINFIVITKGAGRIAEVGARFTLDAMPGKQMAIDADLNAGLIDEAEARRRRAEVAQEAEFYGSMDGASKFVRGDAVAGLIIMAVGMVGGLIVGIVQHGLSAGEAGTVYTLLTIGDGLVGQIPALIISTAAGVVVSRVANDQDVGQQMVGQLFSNPMVLYITGGIVGIMGLIPGMPHLAFLSLAALMMYVGYKIQKKQEIKEASNTEGGAVQRETAQEAASEASWDDVSLVEPLALEVGYRLISLVDGQGKDPELLGRIRSLRKKFAQEMGFLPPVVHVRDNLDLNPNEYRVQLFGVEIGKGMAMPGKWLAIDPGGVAMRLPGEPTEDPTFGLPATWIGADMREQAQIAGYTVVDASTVVATHINHLIHRHASSLLGRQEVQKLLERVEKDVPKLTEDLVPKTLSLVSLQGVLRGLLDEEVPIRDMRTIIETITEWAPRMMAVAQPGASLDIDEMVSRLRQALAASIAQYWFEDKQECNVIGLDANLERVLTQVLTTNGAVEPGLADNLINETGLAIHRQEMAGEPTVLVVAPMLRTHLARYFRNPFPQLAVLGMNEIPADRVIKVGSVIGG